MPKFLIAVGATASSLLFAAPASAGCWTTVDVAPPPERTAAGDAWVAHLTILQHGRNPLPDAREARPTVTIRNEATGETATFPAKVTDAGAGSYAARVVFPSGGTWSYEVYDDFTTADGEEVPCANTHRFEAVEIVGTPGSSGGSPPRRSSFPVWPTVGGALALVAAAIGVLLARGRLGSRATAPTS